MKKDSYFDENGLLHVKKGEYSENGVLFLAEYELLRRLNGKKPLDLQATIAKIEKDDFFDPNPTDNNHSDCHFSHDNMTGLYLLNLLQGNNISHLPTIRWNKRNWLHPRDIIMYNHLKTGFFLAIFISIAAIISAMADKSKTSGKILAFVRLQMLMRYGNFASKLLSRLTYKIFCAIINKKHRGGLRNVFNIYFAEGDHPINSEVKEFVNNG